MPIAVICPNCGHENKTAAVFCTKCGQKIGAPQLERRREPLAVGRWVMGTLRLLAWLALAWVVGSIFWAVPVPKVTVDVDRAQKFSEGISKLHQVLQRGGSTVETVAESDINNYLAWRLQETPEAQEFRGVQLALHAVWVELRSERVRAVVVGGWGPLRISFEVKGLPVNEGQGFQFDVFQARLGHLRLPRAAHHWALGKIRTVLAQMDREAWLLDRARKFDLGDGRVRLTFSGR